MRKNKKSTVLDMIEGIELLIEEQVDIINMSMGDEYKYHKEIEEVCRAATEKGILIVAAYSNQQVEATYPASFPFVTVSYTHLDVYKRQYISFIIILRL